MDKDDVKENAFFVSAVCGAIIAFGTLVEKVCKWAKPLFAHEKTHRGNKDKTV